jgi:hypothetical protein
MSWAAIHKPAREWRVTPNLLDYDALCWSFSWDATRTPLERATRGVGLRAQLPHRADGSGTYLRIGSEGG